MQALFLFLYAYNFRLFRPRRKAGETPEKQRGAADLHLGKLQKRLNLLRQRSLRFQTHTLSPTTWPPLKNFSVGTAWIR